MSMWIALIKSAVKFSLFFLLFVVLSTIYIRGALVFFTKDIQFLSSLLQRLLNGELFNSNMLSQIYDNQNDVMGRFFNQQTVKLSMRRGLETLFGPDNPSFQLFFREEPVLYANVHF